MVIYADILFILNFASTYILLTLCEKCAGINTKTIRRILGALAGGLCAVLLFSAPMIFRIPSFAAISAAAFGKRNFIKNTTLFFIISMLFSASASVIISVFNINAVLKNGIMYIETSWRLFLIIFAVTYPSVIMIYRFFKLRKKFYRLKIIYDGHIINTTALFDSGNLLKEPITGKSVIICEKNVLIEFNNKNMFAVPYYSLGNNNGMIFAFKADSIVIDETKCAKNALIGIYDGKLSDNYHALIGPCF